MAPPYPFQTPHRTGEAGAKSAATSRAVIAPDLL